MLNSFKLTLYFVLCVLALAAVCNATAHTLHGIVHTSSGAPVPGATIRVVGTSRGAVAAKNGTFSIAGVEAPLQLRCTAVGHDTAVVAVADIPSTAIRIVLADRSVQGSPVSVVADRGLERSYANEATIMEVTTAEHLEAASALNLADGLNFQPGIRTENNCRNCGFSQVRINGLAGPYTRLLLNGRPVLSALLGVYGLEQLPTVMIDRIEIQRGAADIAGGPGSIAGSVNIVTRQTSANVVSASVQGTSMPQGATDRSANLFTSTSLNASGTSGLMAFATSRHRDDYDRDGDGFSDVPRMSLDAGGLGLDVALADGHTLSTSAQWIREARRGGDNLNRAPFEAAITEGLDHAIAGGTARYSAVLSAQSFLTVDAGTMVTSRQSYYGGLGAEPSAEDSALAKTYFGTTTDALLTASARYDVQHTFFGSDVSLLTGGIDVIGNAVRDAMPGRERLIDQTTTTTGAFAQMRTTGMPLGDDGTWGWQAGVRLDVVSIQGTYLTGPTAEWQTDRTLAAFTPRLSVDLRPTDGETWRVGYASGFRGPQAFDEDLHVSTLGGEARVVRLAPTLQPERSHSLTLSRVRETEDGFGYTVDGFATLLQRPFLIALTDDVLESGAVVAEKRNGEPGLVYGVNAEVRYDNGTVTRRADVQLQAGVTVQQGRYTAVGGEVIIEQDGNPVRSSRFVRMPEIYGSWLCTWVPHTAVSIATSGIVTGPMDMPNERTSTLIRTPWMVDVSMQATWWLPVGSEFNLGLTLAVLNVFDVFQRDIEQGPLRDGAYSYGPMRPRSIRLGLTTGMGLR